MGRGARRLSCPRCRHCAGDYTTVPEVHHGVTGGRIPPGLSRVAEMTREHAGWWLEVARRLGDLLLAEGEGDVVLTISARAGGVRRPRLDVSIRAVGEVDRLTPPPDLPQTPA